MKNGILVVCKALKCMEVLSEHLAGLLESMGFTVSLNTLSTLCNAGQFQRGRARTWYQFLWENMLQWLTGTGFGMWHLKVPFYSGKEFRQE